MGRLKKKELPSPSLLSTERLPPCSSTSCLPVPEGEEPSQQNQKNGDRDEEFPHAFKAKHALSL